MGKSPNSVCGFSLEFLVLLRTSLVISVWYGMLKEQFSYKGVVDRSLAGWAQCLVRGLEIKFKGHSESEQGNLTGTCG